MFLRQNCVAVGSLLPRTPPAESFTLAEGNVDEHRMAVVLDAYAAIAALVKERARRRSNR